MALTLVLAEDHLIVREGLARLIEYQDGIELVAVCGDFDSLIASVGEHQPAVVLTDIRMPPTNTDEGIRAAELIGKRWPKVGVVVLSQHDEPEYALALLDKGSQRRAYLLKERLSNSEQLVAAIQEVAQGGSVIDPKVVESLVKARARAAQSPIGALTPREREVLSEMAQGKTNAAIAGSLVVTERAVEKHINSMFAKLGLSAEKDVHRRVKAVLMFLSEKS